MPPAANLGQGEAFVAVGGDCVAFLYVGREAADVRHKHTRLARHIGADVPGATGGAQRSAGDFADMRHPALLGLGPGLNAAAAFVAQIPDAVRHPFDVLLDRWQHVGEHRGTTRPGDREEVWEAGDTQAEIGLRTLAPLLLECLAANAADVNLQQRPGHGIEAGGENDRIDSVFLTLCPNADRRDGLDRLATDVDQSDIRAVEGFPVTGVDAEPLAADHVAWREQLGDLRAVHDLADLSAHELRSQVVGRLVVEQVAEGSYEGEASIGPARLELAPASL